jgi:signal peptidase I
LDKKGQEGKWIIPEGQYFMMGDNRDNSTDSRAWGTIEKKDIVAKAFLRYRFWKPLIKGIE